jgi:hypothetical protein
MFASPRKPHGALLVHLTAVRLKGFISGTLLLLFCVAPMLCAASRAWAEPQTNEHHDLAGYAALDQNGAVYRLAEMRGSRATAIVMLSPECPISNQYIPTLNRLGREFAQQQIEFVGVVSDPTLAWSDVAKFAREFSIEIPLLYDTSGDLRQTLQPTHVPESFLLSPRGAMLYSGRIDNRYESVGRRRAKITQHDLRDAMAALLEDREITPLRTTPVGCKLSENARPEVTFSHQIAPILYARCVECHRPGEVAPFALLTCEDATKRADWIAEVVKGDVMPPWTLRSGYGHFRGQRTLSPREKALLTQWAEAGAPRGDEKLAPPVPEFSEGWQLGPPDLVLEMPEAFSIPADGPDIFRFFVLPIEIPEDQTVVAVDFKPGNPRVVHHSILYLDSSGAARRYDEADPLPGYEGFVTGGFSPSGTLGFWAPGYTPRFFPEGVGQRLAKGSDLAMQLHYHPSGKAETDASKVGIYFAKKPVQRYVGGLALIDFDVDIPAGEKQHQMEFDFTLPVAVEIIDVTPHMHLIGTEMKVTATLPDGSTVPLVWVDWDFNWQDQYEYVQPVHLPAGTRIDMVAQFDNSVDNPANPNSPPAHVEFGEETTDEMSICAFRILESTSAEDRKALQAATRQSLFQQLADPKVMRTVRELIMRGRGPAGGGEPAGENSPLQQLFGL